MTVAPTHRSPVAVLAFYFELPFDTRLPDVTNLSLRLADDPVSGWEDVNLRTFEQPTPPGVHETLLLSLRRASDRIRAPGFFTDRVWRREFRAATESLVHRIVGRPGRPRAFIGRPMRHSVSAVRATLITPRPAESSAHLTDAFELALSKLNELLVALSLVASDKRIRPVTRFDLEPAILVRTHALPRPGERPQRPSASRLLLHHDVPVVEDALEPSSLERAIGIASATHDGVQPWFLASERLEAARRLLYSGQLRTAVLDAGTAAEVFIATALREAGPHLSPSVDWAKRLDSPVFRDCFEHLLPGMLGWTVDLENGSGPIDQWYRDAYLLRNAVAHNGVLPSFAATERSVQVTMELVLATGDQLRANPETRVLGEKLIGPNDRE